MRRTAADFAREASDDDFEIQLGTGSKKRWVKPRPASEQTYEQQKEHSRLLGAYARWGATGAAEFPADDDGHVEMEPVEFSLRCRFDAVTQDPKTKKWSAAASKDFDDFWAEYVLALPWKSVVKLLNELDDHYDPQPATDAEKAAAAAAALLRETRDLVAGSDISADRLGDLLTRIDSTLERAEESTGKSPTAAG